MKTYLSILIIILSFTTSFSQTREWKSINVPAHDNCYGLLNYEIQRRPTSSNPELYEARIIFTTGQFDNDFEFSFKGRKEGSWGRITVPATGKKIVELFGTYTLSESIYYDTERLRYLGLELKHLRGEEQYVKCGEGRNEVLRRDKAKGKNKANNTSSEVLDNQKNDTDNETTENDGYQVIGVDTTAYEAEKARKQELLEEQTNSRIEETLKEENKAQFKAKQLTDAQNFIDNQNQQAANQKILNQKLADDLTQTFTQISDSWAKERDFQSKISSLTNIKSINASSIISEARSKAHQINIEYGNIKDDALNQGVNATQTLINSAQNEKQAIAGGILGTLGTIASQSNLEKNRKDAQAKLQNEKESALRKLAKNIIDKYEPLKMKHLEAATYAVEEDIENYHILNYNFANCMIINAYEIVVNDYSCQKPELSKKSTQINSKYSGREFYSAYKRKFESTIDYIAENSIYFLDLAIEAEPNNANYLYEKVQTKKFRPREAASILKKALEFDSNNEKIETTYNYYLEKVREEEKKEKLSIEEWLNGEPIEDSQNWQNHNNILIIPHFNEEKNLEFFAINNQKEILFRLEYDLTISLEKFTDRNFNDGLLLVKKREVEGMESIEHIFNYGYINTKGEVTIPFNKYARANPFRNGFAKVIDFATKEAGFIDTTGKKLVNCNFQDANNFFGGVAAVRDTKPNSKITNHFWGYINTKGELIIPYKYFQVSQFSEGLAAVKELPEKIKKKFNSNEILSHYIDSTGNKVITGEYYYASLFSNGLAAVGDNKNFWYIDKSGNKAFYDEFDMADDFNNQGYAIVRKGKNYYFINKKGKNESGNVFISKPNFGLTRKKSDVKISKKTYVTIDKTGKIIAK